MSWKKNRFSYLMWFAYALMTGAALISLAGMFCTKAEMAAYWGILFAALYIAAVGGIVFLLRRIAGRCIVLAVRHHTFFLVLEVAIVLLLATVGVVLRIHGMADAGQTSEYYDAAKVVTGQRIPQTVHGAVYFYIRLLHAAFLLLGNYFIVGIWIQMALQLVASVLLFFMVRKLVGPIAALISFGFYMCAPYIVKSTFLLSPGTLYLVFILAAAALVTSGYQKKRNPAVYLFTGLASALCFYIDIAGCLILFLALAVIFCSREEGSEAGRKIASVVLCLIGAALGFLMCIFLDALMSGKSIQGVLGAWFLLYRPEKIQLSLGMSVAGSEIECLILSSLMVFGIFSFWCDRKKERLSVSVLAAACLMLAGSFGIFTAEMPGFIYLYLLCTVLAGVGLQQCFHALPAAAKDMDTVEEGAETAQESEAVEDREPNEKMEQSEENVRKVQFIENPLPLPKKHVKRVMDYSRKSASENDDFDYPVGEDDDFDI